MDTRFSTFGHEVKVRNLTSQKSPKRQLLAADRRLFFGPGLARLQRRGSAEDVGLMMHARHHLQAHRQSSARESGRYRRSRLACQVERVGVVHPGDDVAVG